METTQDQKITFEQSIENYKKELCKREALYRIKNSMRSRFRHSLKRYQQTKCDGMSVMIGCSWSFFTKWIESKFSKKMNWDNYGTYWHLDHIQPFSRFDVGNQKDMKEAWHYTNLQPLKVDENRRKSDKIITHQPELLLTIYWWGMRSRGIGCGFSQ